MLRQNKLKRLAAVGMLICIPELVSCSADEPKPSSTAAKAAAPAEASPADLSIADPAFDRYVDLVMLGRAWDALDASLITDCALQLAEGERVLKRNHKAINSNQVLALAVKVAADKNDTAALDRLAKIGETTKNTAITEQVAAANKLGGKSRKVTAPAFSISVDETTPSQLAIYQEIISEVNAAAIIGDTTFFKNFEGAFNDKKSMLASLTETQRKRLRQIMGESTARMPKEADNRLSDTIAKLKSVSRSTPFVPNYPWGDNPGTENRPWPVQGGGFGGGGTVFGGGRPFGGTPFGGTPFGQGGGTPFGQGSGQRVSGSSGQGPYGFGIRNYLEQLESERIARESGLRGCFTQPYQPTPTPRWNDSNYQRWGW